ncbi:MAG: hypothetical protein QF752_05760 [Planctomycetota bacterium]|nr:hypothetical protein [Planctomycetota bacterium]
MSDALSERTISRMSEEEKNRSVCEDCGSEPASQVRYERVVSYLVLTDSRDLERVLCRRCSSRAGVREQIVSSLVGWWGLPFGLLTMRAMWTNLRSLRAHAQWSFGGLFLLGVFALGVPIGAVGLGYVAVKGYVGEDSKVDLHQAESRYRSNMRLARLALRGGNPAEACHHFSQGLPDLRLLTADQEPVWWPEVADYCFGYARAQEQIGYYAAAQKNLESALRQIHRVPKEWRTREKWKRFLGNAWRMQLAWSRIWRRQGNLKGALRSLETLVSGNIRQTPEILLDAWTGCLEDAGRDEEALRFLDRCREELDADCPVVLEVRRFRIRRKRGLAAKDLPEVRNLLKAHPENREILRCFQNHLLALGEWESAYRLFEERAKDPGQKNDILLWARLQGKVHSRADCLERLITSEAVKEDGLRFALVSLYWWLGRDAEVERSMPGLMSRIPGPIRVLQARIEIDRGRPGQARKILESSLVDLPADQESISLLVRMDLQEGHLRAAAERVERAVRFAEGNPELQFKLRRSLAARLREMGHWDMSQKIVEELKPQSRKEFLREVEFESTRGALEEGRPARWEIFDEIVDCENDKSIETLQWKIRLGFWQGVESALTGEPPEKFWREVASAPLEPMRGGARFSVLAARLLIEPNDVRRRDLIDGAVGLFEGWRSALEFVLGLVAERSGKNSAAQDFYRRSLEANPQQSFPFHLVARRLGS